MGAVKNKSNASLLRSGWIDEWVPEDQTFWNETGRRIAWQTLTITTISLMLSFATWFVMSAVVVRLPSIGFEFSTLQLFWLGAMPGLAGGTLRIVNTFLIPLFGTRHVVSIATLLKVFPVLGLGLAVMNPDTPFWVFVALALALGLGGGDFSSYMPSTSLFFPRRLQETALGIQAGIANFGVSLTQFVTPWIIGFALFGALLGGSQTFVKGDVTRPMWVQNSVFWFVPFLLVVGIAAWLLSGACQYEPLSASNWTSSRTGTPGFCTITYVMTFFALGYEHSVVNMYLIPSGMLLGAPISIGDWWLWNQLPVTLGNIVGGGVFTGVALYAIYGRRGAHVGTVTDLPSVDEEEREVSVRR